ncbi:hypothetical protein F7725_000059 [Dissostichus mawsoni]|uniref:Uncharacterized protein n=1 Tax=Dissostichus mawsoni TaxID=36200 RepID=A0A7J5ZDA2_DISMA|nr:hypothetical protein F7725_000059 [Dissostichus mawsoni]
MAALASEVILHMGPRAQKTAVEAGSWLAWRRQEQEAKIQAKRSQGRGEQRDTPEGRTQRNYLAGKWQEDRAFISTGEEVCAVFHRITNVNLRNQLFSELDRHTLRLIALYRQKAARTGKVSEALPEILRICDLQEVQDVHLKRNAALRALQLYQREEDPQLFKYLVHSKLFYPSS